MPECVYWYTWDGPTYYVRIERRVIMALIIPACITATRIGHWSFGSESEYDADGEQAPITWQCACGAWLKLENLVLRDSGYDDDYMYVAVSEATKVEFLAQHQSCEIVCFHCHKVPVDRPMSWCEKCSDEAEF